ncbi:MAG: hypothetical protein WAK24_11865 [Candidatus Acidiferrales bacterium]
MKKTLILLVMAILVLAAHLEGQKPQRVSGDATSCAGSPLLSELSKASGEALLRLYGYNLHEPWACSKITSPWATGSMLLHFRRVTNQTDDSTAFSVLKAAGVSRLWIIPTDTGMLEVQNAKNDVHNLAAFNALLQSLPKIPSSAADWNAIGKLYLELLGRPDAVSPEDGTSSPCSADGECSVAFSEVPRHGNDPYTKLTLTFSAPNGSNPARLTDVTREIVRPSEN